MGSLGFTPSLSLCPASSFGTPSLSDLTDRVDIVSLSRLPYLPCYMRPLESVLKGTEPASNRHDAARGASQKTHRALVLQLGGARNERIGQGSTLQRLSAVVAAIAPQVRKTANPFTCVPSLLKITTKQEEKIKSIDVGRESNARRLPPSHHISTMGHCRERAVGSRSRTPPLPSRIDASRTTEGMRPRLWNTPLVALEV